MKGLQETLDKLIEEQFLGDRLIAHFQKQLTDMGVTLTESQRREIKDRLKESRFSSLSLSLQDDQVPAQLRGTNQDDGVPISIDLELSDTVVSDLAADAEKWLETLLPGAIPEISRPILGQLKADVRGMLRDRRKVRRAFESRLARRWRAGLRLLEMMIVIATEAGDDFSREFRPQAAKEQDCVFEVLTRLHARACQVASEVLTLIRSGYPDGAHARWRSLHEIAVVAFFVGQHGQDVAERYLLHQAVESWRAAQEYQGYCVALGYTPFEQDEMDSLERNKDLLIRRFGKSYAGNYGWAAHALKLPRPSFADIEKAVGLDKLRPYYRMASHNIHANPKGVFVKLGLAGFDADLLLAGPSQRGLADPGHGTAISITQATTALLTSQPNLDRLVICDVLRRLQQETGAAFMAAHEPQQEESSPDSPSGCDAGAG